MQNDTPAPMRILDLQWREAAGGHEFESTIEISRPDGSKSIVREYWREIDLGDSYMTVRHAVRDAAPAQTFFIYGRKGEVQGDFRTDRTEMLTLQTDGSVRRTEQTVKTWLKGDAMRAKIAAWYRDGTEAGLTADEIFRLIWSLENPAN
ncbi:MAG: hypothetical protein C5B51_09930 [Terriglobia bacterium]|nr:MAG: hypothetical protein C5B51_09930 [Terriglobia bacterium]